MTLFQYFDGYFLGHSDFIFKKIFTLKKTSSNKINMHTI